MYDGIRLQTPGGSGTAGHIQSNKFSVAKSTNYKVNDKIAAAVAERIEPRGATSKEILEHERKHQIELKLVVLEDNLVDHGCSDVEIANKLSEARQNLESGVTPLLGSIEDATISSVFRSRVTMWRPERA